MESRNGVKPVLLGAAAAVVAIALVVGGYFAVTAMRGGSEPAAEPTHVSTPQALDGPSSPAVQTPSAKPSQTSAVKPAPILPVSVELTTQTFPANRRWTEMVWTKATVSGGAEGVATRMNATIDEWVRPEFTRIVDIRQSSPNKALTTPKGSVSQEIKEIVCKPSLLCLRMFEDDRAPGQEFYEPRYLTLVLDRKTGETQDLSDFVSTKKMPLIKAWVESDYLQEAGYEANVRDDRLFTLSGLKSWLPLKEGLWLSFSLFQLGEDPLQTVVNWSDLESNTGPPVPDTGNGMDERYPLDSEVAGQIFEATSDRVCHSVMSDQPDLFVGDSGDYVLFLQDVLYYIMDFDPGPINGEFTSETESAVMDMQSFLSINPDGQVGPNTWNALQQYHCGN